MLLTREETQKLDLTKIKRVHMIGLLSPFTSVVAELLHKKGIKVTASEKIQNDPALETWLKKGILMPGEQKAENITDDIDLAIFPTGAIPGNPECDEVTKRNIPTALIADIFGLVTKGYKTIAIAGTHGKTTTSSIIVWMIKEALGMPNFIIGDNRDSILGIDKNWNLSDKSEYFVIEACEYRRQFLGRAPHPYISVITHIDIDHTDYYKDQDDYNNAFEEFIGNTRHSVVIDATGKNESSIIEKVTEKFLQNNVFVIDTNNLKNEYPTIESNLVGHHNYENLLRAVGVGKALGLSEDSIRSSLASFQGVSRRFEFVGFTENNNPIHNDYAHNPAKLKSCLQGARQKYPDRKIVLIYQPHNFERSYTFRNELAEAISNSDVVIFPGIYSVRESELEKSMITNEKLFEIFEKHNPTLPIFYTQNFDKTISKIKEIDSQEKYAFVIASAGDLPSIIPEILHHK